MLAIGRSHRSFPTDSDTPRLTGRCQIPVVQRSTVWVSVGRHQRSLNPIFERMDAQNRRSDSTVARKMLDQNIEWSVFTLNEHSPLLRSFEQEYGD